jgi:predicted MFS family arabinose efflux permease
MTLARRPRPFGAQRIALGLGTTQMLGWGSSYYLPAMLAVPMALELALPTHWVLAAFSWALVVCACMGPISGAAIDRFGGRPVLCLASLLFAVGLGLLSQAQGPVLLFAAWTVIGAAMAAGLYEAAFATVVKWEGTSARRSITGITLLGGLASTLSWPLTAWLETQFGWRGACLVWAGLHLLVSLPIHALLQPAPGVPAGRQEDADAMSSHPPSHLPAHQHRRAALLLASAFATTWFISTAMAAHLPALLQAQGMSLATAVLLGGLIGPAQVLGRVAEFSLLQRVPPLRSARLAAALHPLGACMFVVLGTPAGAAFVLLHGAGNGVLTIAQGSLPLALFGPQGYGRRQGMLMLPARCVQALAPLLFGLALQRWGAQALWLSAALGGACLGALMLLPGLPRTAPKTP